MSKKTIMLSLARMMQAFNEVTTNQGNLISDGELNVGVDVFVTTEDGELIPAPTAVYETDAMIYTVENGIIMEVKEKEFTPETIEEEPEVVVEEEAKEEVEEPAEPENEEEPAVDEEKEALKEENAALKAEVEELKKKIEELEAELAKPVDEPLEKQENEFNKTEKDGVMERLKKVAEFKIGK